MKKSEIEDYWELEIRAGNKDIEKQLSTFKRGQEFLKKRAVKTGSEGVKE